MTDRDRLIELIGNMPNNVDSIVAEADYLIANGVIIPPCKVGDTYYRILYGKIYENEFICMATIVSMMEDGAFGKTVFLTREEAEKALERSKGNA